MKNKRLKNSLIAAVVAICSGVVLFGVNAAIGEAPSYTPPGSGVSPVFSALEVTGDIDADGGIVGDTVYGEDWVSAANMLFSWNDAAVMSDIGAGGNITAGGDIVLSGLISNDFLSWTVIDDAAKITGDTWIEGDFRVDGAFGRFYEISTSASGTGVAWTTCDAADHLVNCGGYTTSGGSIDYLTPWGNTCWISSANGSANVTATALCFDPDGASWL